MIQYSTFFSNFARRKVITFDDKDSSWINEDIKCKTKSKSKTFQQFKKMDEK